MRLAHAERLGASQPLAERVIFGPEPPVGVARFPRPSTRCLLGLHLWRRVWDFTRVEESEEDGKHTARFSVNLDRPCDYVECARCNRMRG